MYSTEASHIKDVEHRIKLYQLYHSYDEWCSTEVKVGGCDTSWVKYNPRGSSIMNKRRSIAFRLPISAVTGVNLCDGKKCRLTNAGHFLCILVTNTD